MRHLTCSVLVMAVWLCTGTVCAPVTDSSQLFLVGADADDVFVEYYPEYDGFVPWPSSLWSVDLDTGESNRIYDVRQLYFVQAEGDYYVAEEPLEDGKQGRIFGVQISTGRRMNIETHDTPNGTDYDGGEFILSAGRVVVHTADGLLLYDLAADRVVRTIPLPSNDAFLTAFRNDIAVLGVNTGCDGGCESAGFILVDVDAPATVEVDGPMTGTGFYFGSALSDDWLFTTHTAYPNASVMVIRVLGYHIPEQEWKTVIEYEPVSVDTFAPPVVFVTGGNDAYALIVELRSPLVLSSEVRIALADLDTGQLTTVFQAAAILDSPTQGGRLLGNTVRWITKSPKAAYVYDIATGVTRVVPFEIPK